MAGWQRGAAGIGSLFSYEANTDIFGFWNKLSSQLERQWNGGGVAPNTPRFGAENHGKSLDTEVNHGKTSMFLFQTVDMMQS